MSSRKIKINNDLGIHLRAAGVLAQVAGGFESDIWLERDGTRANAKSIMSILSLAASQGVELEIIAEGPDSEAAVETIAKLIDEGFEG